jgi:AraC-like DNA-binding protein
LKTIAHGREVLSPGYSVPRHRHLAPYAIVVIRGAFDQVGYAGRLRLVAGDLLVQPTLDAHSNAMPRTCGATILRLPWHDIDDLGGAFALRDVDTIARAAERDIVQAVHLVRAQQGEAARRSTVLDLPDLLATDLIENRVASLERWAIDAGITRETASRAFTRAFGVSARQFRAELRARAAWLRIVRSHEALAEIANATDFADQPHMTRHVQRLTGQSPAAWRRDARVAMFRRLDVAGRRANRGDELA